MFLYLQVEETVEVDQFAAPWGKFILRLKVNISNKTQEETT